jgi:hypothetical protein
MLAQPGGNLGYADHFGSAAFLNGYQVGDMVAVAVRYQDIIWLKAMDIDMLSRRVWRNKRIEQ